MIDGTAPIRHPHPEPPAEGEACEVADGILWLRLPLPMALDHVNCYALADPDGWTIVDTGFDTQRTRAIWRRLLDGPLSGYGVARVLVTHHHPDHIGLAGWMQTELGAELITTRTAWLTARMLVLDEQALPDRETLAFWQGAGMDPDLLARRSTARPFNFAGVVAPLPPGFRRIRDGGSIELAGRTWDIRTGDGHAPEHVTLWSRAGDVVIGGDQLLASISPNLGVYASEPDADPVGEWLDSCMRLRAHAHEDQLVLPGHKLPYTGLPTRMRQLIENHESALIRLRGFVATPRIATECFPLLFKRPITEDIYGFALVEAMAHLNHLHRAGHVRRWRREDGAWLWQALD